MSGDGTLSPRTTPPENGRTLARLYSNVFTTYQQELRSALDWFDQQELTVSSIENLCVRVRRVADALGDEAGVLEQRSRLRDASTFDPPPLLGVAVQGDRGLELHAFRTSTGGTVSVLGESDGAARKDGS